MIENVISCKCRFCGEEASFSSRKKYSALKYICRNKKCRKHATYFFYICAKKRVLLYEEIRLKEYIIYAYYENETVFEKYGRSPAGTVKIKDKKNKTYNSINLSADTIENISDLSKANKIIKSIIILQ